MMKFYYTILFIAYSICLSAQSNQEVTHLEFLGIPITGELDVFVSKVIEKNRGFVVVKKNLVDDFPGFTSTKLEGGSFWKFKNCLLNVRYHNKLELVTSVIVACNEAQEKDFEDIIMSFDKKYGEHFENDLKDGWMEYLWWVNNDGRVIVTEAKKHSLISIKYEDFPEAVIEAEKEMKKMLYKGQKEDVDL